MTDDLNAYHRAREDLAQAYARLSWSQAAREAEERDRTPFDRAVELARRRVQRRLRDFKAAEFLLTGGRPVEEVLWTWPDDL